MNFLEIFEKLAFPVAVSVSLMAILVYILNRSIHFLRQHIEKNEEQQTKFIEYLQHSNIQLRTIIEQQNEIIKNNTSVMMSFTRVVAHLKKRIHMHNTKMAQ